MPDATETKGGCLCGAVRFAVRNLDKNVGACHCGTCRKWGGGPFMGVDCGSEVSFDGGEKVSVFNSSEWAERGFCRECGTHLFYRLKKSGRHVMPAGLFGGGFPFVFTHQVFVDEKPGFYRFANETEDMTGEECFAKFASRED